MGVYAVIVYSYGSYIIICKTIGFCIPSQVLTIVSAHTTICSEP